MNTILDWLRLGWLHTARTPGSRVAICRESLAGMRDFASGAGPHPDPDDPRVRALLAIVDRYYDHPTLSLARVARKLNLSTWHLGRLFKEGTGLGFRRHLRGVRLAQGERLLVTTFLSVKEVATQVGYKHVSDFVQHFKARYGLPPARYRGRTGRPEGAHAPALRQEARTNSKNT